MRAPLPSLPALFLLVFLLAAPGSGQEKLKAADAELEGMINKALDTGAVWLKRQQRSDGSFPSEHAVTYPMGPTGLSLLALLHSGVPRKDPAIAKGFGYLRRQYDALKKAPGSGRGLKVYSVSVTIMALVEYGREKRTRSRADDRYARGGADGLKLSKPDLEWLTELTDWLVKQQQGGAWRYPSGGYDHSNSQYALLALKEARMVGVEVPEAVFVRALKHFLGMQEKDGPKVRRQIEEGGDGVYAAKRTVAPGYDRARGWAYVGRSPITGSMTTAGVAAVAICKSELKKAKHQGLVAKAETSNRDGLAWLGKNFSVRKNPGMGPGWHYYYLYGLERAGILSGVVYMGEHRWYAEGARYLVNAQGANGSWHQGAVGPRMGGFGGVEDQSFALLFLARATTRAAGPVTEEPLLDLTRADKLTERAARDLFDAALAELKRLPLSRQAKRAHEFSFFGPRVIGWLLPLLSSPDLVERKVSVRVLRAVTGLTHGYDPNAAFEERETAADLWMGWYLRNRAALKLDREARRIR